MNRPDPLLDRELDELRGNIRRETLRALLWFAFTVGLMACAAALLWRAS